MPTPQIDFNKYLKRIPAHAQELPRESEEPSANRDRYPYRVGVVCQKALPFSRCSRSISSAIAGMASSSV